MAAPQRSNRVVAGRTVNGTTLPKIDPEASGELAEKRRKLRLIALF
jgi:hypothetical protein